MAAGLKELHRQLESEVNSLRSLQKDVNKSHQMRRQYTVQHNENELVQKELELLEEDAAVFKLIGPVLVRQDLVEAKTNVAKRISYISEELKRLNLTQQTLEHKEAAKREDIVKLQQRIAAVKAQP